MTSVNCAVVLSAVVCARITSYIGLSCVTASVAEVRIMFCMNVNVQLF